MSRLSLAVVSVVLAAMLAPAAAAGQPSEAPSSPRTAWGDPDLQGIWNNATLTPLQRPGEPRGPGVPDGGGRRPVSRSRRWSGTPIC